MNRRQSFQALSAAACGTLLPALAQQAPKVWRIGFLAARSRPTPAKPDIWYDMFTQSMRKQGYIDGKNLVIEWRFADGDYKRLPGLAAELVREKVDLIVAASTVATQAAKNATTSIPIVAVGVGDPVGTGFAASLARPGGNITGFANISPDIGPKRVELLIAIAPQTKNIGVLGNPDVPTYPIALKGIQAAGQKAGINILPFPARTPEEIERSLTAMSKERIRAVVVFADSLFMLQTKQIATLVNKHRLAAVFSYRAYVEAGGLMSYGPDDAEGYRRASIYVDKILKGAKPGELPFEQPATFHLAINGKTAKTLGLKISQELLLRADEVIE